MNQNEAQINYYLLEILKGYLDKIPRKKELISVLKKQQLEVANAKLADGKSLIEELQEVVDFVNSCSEDGLKIYLEELCNS